MKMEPTPWIKDYEVEMDKLYCELTLEKLENDVSEVKRRPLANYKELFDEHCKHEKDVEITESGSQKEIANRMYQNKWRTEVSKAKGKEGVGKRGPRYRENESPEANCF